MRAGEALRRLGERRPLVHHITNYVSVGLVANTTLCTGALPVMAHAREEVAEMSGAAGALVLNIGTLDERQVESMLAAGKSANERGIPVVLDPVGAGATRMRTLAAERLLSELEVSAVCGNAGEIATLAGLSAEVRGVESIGGDAGAAAREAAASLGLTVAATGPVDYVCGGGRALAVENGHPLLGRVVGSGCASTAVIGCFAAAAGSADPETVAHALAYFGCAGEEAARTSGGPGTFEGRLLDALAAFAADPSVLSGRLRVSDAG
ncbi:Hydroxyethylthiazole kinase [Rubrobacter xylanophilus DSM 9941]|uniref:hydroxyethylthiazole kinase n=1 Tax=Rubrobacter xylanophilus TaxID=49319 RepID=UPI001C641458|nr:hydroxyethylthiazole kinase [Rubrobacter xylanophilus]QYJ15829.1 Hydroxyethylthiazole kinase [Rubrobacter xylanophilus DSM 9941]